MTYMFDRIKKIKGLRTNLPMVGTQLADTKHIMQGGRVWIQ